MNTLRPALVLSLCLCISMHAKIQEIDSLSQILDYVGTGTSELVIFDIDDTLLRGLTEESTNRWFCAQVDRLVATGLSTKQAVEIVLPPYTAAQCMTEVELIDNQTLEILEKLATKDVLRIALTARGRAPLIDATFRQFSDMGISYTQDNSKWQQEFTFAPLPGETLYKDGVLFCDGNKKSTVLEMFFERMGYLPEHIIFIDDELGNIKTLEQLAEKLHIRFDGFHFLRARHELTRLPEPTTSLVATP